MADKIVDPLKAERAAVAAAEQNVRDAETALVAAKAALTAARDALIDKRSGRTRRVVKLAE